MRFISVAALVSVAVSLELVGTAQAGLILQDQISGTSAMGPMSGSCAGDLFIGGVDVTTLQWTCDDLGQAPCRFPPDKGLTFEATGTASALETLCSVEKPIACCGPVP